MKLRLCVREFQLDANTRALFEAEVGAAFRAEVSTSQVYTIVAQPSNSQR
jgi:hypothetical protein